MRRERAAEKGKQFLVNGPKSGRTPDTYFGLDNAKKHLYVSEVSAAFSSKRSAAFLRCSEPQAGCATAGTAIRRQESFRW